jgi:SAM-dependent methyltransferase
MSAERLAYAHEELSSVLVQALCRSAVAGGVNLDIHADDEMYRFFLYTLGYSPEQAAAAYLDSGALLWKTLRQVIAWWFGSPRACRRILDFASGYGRVARHIAAEMPRGAVWVSDVLAAAVAFQERHLGVQGLVSVSDPEQFATGVDFDCIVVSSLFTHLPPARFAGWLRRLGAALAPGGMLLWSVHDLTLRPDGPPASGIVFEAKSESGKLAADEYGSTWVSEEYVRAAARAAVAGCLVHRIPRALGNFQDLYVLLPPAGARGGGAFEGLRVERSPDGFVEECRRAGRLGLWLSGWVGDRLTGRPPLEVRATVDGAPAAVSRDLQPRGTVTRVTDHGASDPIAAVSWRLLLRSSPLPFADGAQLRLTVLTADGEELELFADSVGGALLRSAQLDLCATQLEVQEAARLRGAGEQLQQREAEIACLRGNLEQLEQRLAAMRASRFWRLRDRWFRFKRWARLTTEP